MQHDRQLKVIASRLEKKIKSELESMLLNDATNTNPSIRTSVCNLNTACTKTMECTRMVLQDLLLFYSSSEKKLVTLKEYVGRMKEGQKYIYYACGETTDKIDMLPQTEALKDKGYEILYLTDNVDEFALRMMMKYDDKEIRSISADDLDLETEEEKQAAAKKVEENKDMLAFMKESLDGKVKEVILSQKLKTHPVCLSSEGAISIEMEKVLNSMPNDQKVQAQRVLEINSNHPIFEKLCSLYAEDKDKLKEYTQLLYDQALLIEGVSIDDPVAFSNRICNLMV